MMATAFPYSVLIVEDNEDLVIGLRDLLQHDGYAVTVSGTVAGAIELLRTHRFNAVLLDLELPDGDGLEVMKETHRLDPSLPVVIVTAHISQDRTVRSLTEGAFAYLTKPYHREELRQTLQRAIGAKELAVKVERTEHLLSQSEERLELVIQGSNDGFWDGRVLPDEPWSAPRTPVWWSPRVKAMLGYTDEEFPDVLESWASRLHPEDHDRVFAALTAHIERRDPYDVEYRLLTKAGEYGWFRARGQAIWDETGQITRMAGSLQCVTDRKRAEEALRRHEQLLQDVVNNTTAVIYVKYTDGRYLLINRRFEEIFHLTTDQIIGHTDHEIFPKDFADAFRANDITVAKRNTAVEYEEYAPHADGPHAYISIKFPLCDHTGKPYATCGISTDITERKKAERAVQESQERFHQLTEHIREVFWMTDPEKQQMLYVSPGYEAIWGRSCESLYASPQSWHDSIHPEDRRRVIDAVTHKQAVGTYDEQYRILRPDGTIRWISDRAFPIRDSSGIVYRIVGLAGDITDQVRIQESLRASEERLELVIQGSNDGFWDGRVLPNEPWNSPHTPVWWSPRVKTLLGYTDEEFPDVLESWSSRLHPEDHDRVFSALTDHIERRNPYDVEYRLLTKGGDYGWFRARGQALWDKAGRITRMTGSLQCVTDRKRAEDTLLRNEQLLQNVINNTTALVYVKDANGRFLLTNRLFEEVFHLTTAQIVGHTDHEIFPRDIADAFRANDVTVLERNAGVEFEEYAPHADGIHTSISLKFPLCDFTGKPYATCGISIDITGRTRVKDDARTKD